MKLFIFVILLIFLISIVSANEVGISPGKIDFNGKAGDALCKEITLFTKDKETLSGGDRWSAKDSRELGDYNMRADDFGIEIDYIKSIEFKGSQNIEVCIRALESGVYYGALIYQVDSAGVGTWIKVNISGDENKKINPGIARITGNAINENNSGMFIFAIGEVLFLVVIFLVLIYVIKKTMGHS